ncbi:MAG TPA: hypothetical protein VNG33_03630, partial [Polyangiaceae bacterium]|nr:hypothetical protein [Polyangiaceae bacterium]
MHPQKPACFALCAWLLACSSSTVAMPPAGGGAADSNLGGGVSGGAGMISTSGGGVSSGGGGAGAQAGSPGAGVATGGALAAAGTAGEAAGMGGGAAAGGSPDMPLAAPTQATYLAALYGLVDLLLTTQITDKSDKNYGALVSPSTNPDNHALHSRAAEAVYPLAVAYKHSQDQKYVKAALPLGDWLISLQT